MVQLLVGAADESVAKMPIEKPIKAVGNIVEVELIDSELLHE